MMAGIQSFSKCAVLGAIPILVVALFLCVGEASAAETGISKGIALRMAGKPGEALEAFKEALERSPENVAALVQMGACQEDLGKWREAEQTYLRALEVQPENPTARRNLEQLLAAREINTPPSPQNPTAEVLLRRGLAAAEAKQYDAALNDFQTVRGLSPQDPRPLFYSALLWERQGEQTRAADLYRKTIELFPEYAPARINLIIVLMESGAREAAVATAKLANERLPRDQRISYLTHLLGGELRAYSY
ncbi:MAG: tetratricopeptide repeat protein [Deltaproteobacteria bacterium]|nr:tetratricopeptide repeat protein [Deltaproteobacteria bacterium]